MPSSHRKLLLFPEPHYGDDHPRSDSSPNIPSALLPPTPHSHPQLNTPITMSLMAFAVAASLLLGFLVASIRRYCLGQNVRGSSSPVLFSMQVDPLREDDQGRVDHPISSINTVGLDRSCINSIAVCEFKKGDGLIDGTECTICLGEYEEGDNLRLLPKCSHAFHVPCIDTWLRSHKNCPLCRAPIVGDVPLPCRGVNLEESCLNNETLERSSTTVSGSDNAGRCNSEGEGGSRGENEVRKEKGIRRTMAIDSRSRFTKEARRASDEARASKNGESSRNKIRRSSSDSGILSHEKTSRQTLSHLP